MKIIKNGILVTPGGKLQASLGIENGKIAKIGRIEPSSSDEIFDAGGCFVYPGFIDGHTHLDLESAGTVTSDDFESGTRAAACGGTTLVVDFVSQNEGESMQYALDRWHKKADGKCTSNYAFHMGIGDWNKEAEKELPSIRKQGIQSYKVYMAYDFSVNDRELYEIMCDMKEIGGMLGCHCENGDLVRELQAKEVACGHLDPSAHPVSRPPEVEAEAINRYLYIASLADVPVYVVHLSTKLGLEEIRAARKRGQTVYAETCTQYLLLDDSNYSKPGFEGAKYVMSPPLRKKEDIEALKEACINGEILEISTDHCDFNFCSQKIRGKDNFTKIPNGGPGIEHRPVVVFNIFGDKLDENQYAELLSSGSAKLFGMYPRKGAVQEGSDADLVVWDPHVEWTISADNQHQNVDYTPFEGMEVKGQARFVFVNGSLVARDGQPTGIKAGKFVES